MLMPSVGLITGPQKQATATSLREFKKETGYSDAKISKISTVNKTYINNILTGRFDDIPFNSQDESFRLVQCAIDRERRAIAARRPTGFVFTKVAKMIINGVRKATTIHSWFIFTGNAGIGKSFAVDVLQAEIPTVVTIRIGSNNRTPTNFLRSLHIAIRGTAGRADARFDDIVTHLRSPAGVAQRMVVVIDEAHQAARKTWDVWRDIFDSAQCSFVCIGTGELNKCLIGEDTADVGQISSRIALRANLTEKRAGGSTRGLGPKLFTVEDVRKLFYEDGLRLHPSAADDLLDLANDTFDDKRGALRRAGWVFHFAVSAAREDGVTEITSTHITEALEYIRLGGMRRQRGAKDETQPEASPAVAVG